MRKMISLLLLGAASLSSAFATESPDTSWHRATGLAPVFPAGQSCAAVDTHYGSSVRHGGMHLSNAPGTPVVAVADGQVIAAGQGSKDEGHFVWLRLAPADTGLPFWAFVKYQHLAEPAAVKTGTQVARGQVIARTGAGSPELVAVYGPSPAFRLGGPYQSMVKSEGAVRGDPLIVYLDSRISHPAAVHELPTEQRRVAVAAASADGRIRPANAKTLWPLACRD